MSRAGERRCRAARRAAPWLLALAVAAPARRAAAQASTACAVTPNNYSERFANTTNEDPNSSVAGWGSGSLALSFKAGAFPNPSSLGQLGERAYAMVTGDFDNNGFTDVMFVTDKGGSCHIDYLANNGGGNFTLVGQVATCSSTTAAVLAAGDIDADGDVDLVYAAVTNPSQAGTVASAQLLRNNGPVAGLPQLQAVDITATLQAQGVAWHIGGNQLALFDWDGDNRADLLALSSSGNTDTVLLFSAQPTFGIASTPTVLLADAGLDNPIASASNAATGGYACTPSIAFSRGGSVLLPTDFNGDGAPDLVTGSVSENTLQLFLQASDGSMVRNTDLQFPAGAPLLGFVDDMDGDGTPDIVIGRSGNDCNGPTGEMWLFFNGGQGNFTLYQNRLGIGGVLAFGAVLDVDADNVPDIVGGKLTGVGAYTLYKNTPATNVYNPNSLALSRPLGAVDPRQSGVVSLTLTNFSPTLPSGTSATLQVSNDGGVSWEALTASELAGAEHTFTHFGSSVRWRVLFSAPPATLTGTQKPYTPGAVVTPRLTALAFTYNTVGQRLYSRSGLAEGTFVSGGSGQDILYAAGFLFPGYEAFLWAYDIGKLVPGSGPSTSLARVDNDVNVGLRWEAGQLLSSRTGASRTLYTAYPVTTAGTDFVTRSLTNGRIPFTAAEAQTGGSSPSVAQQLATMMNITALSSAQRQTLMDFVTNGMGDPNGWKMLDLGHSSPVFVGAPAGDANYLTLSPTNPYASFASSQAGRTPVVLLGSNDGYLHGFSADNGQELWGFVPPNLLPKVKSQRAVDANNVVSYFHSPFVDGSIVTADVVAGSGWRSIAVVGEAQGQGLGGNNYYFALDLTNPANPLPLWEFSDVWQTPRAGCTAANNTGSSCTPSCTTNTSSCRPECSAYDSLFSVDSASLNTPKPIGYIEAEHFDNELSSTSAPVLDWSPVTTPLSGALPGNTSSGGYVQASSTSTTCSGTTTAAMAGCTQLTYRFTVATAGTYYPWARLYTASSSSDTINIGLDGSYLRALTVPMTGLLNWTWVAGSASTLTVGEHTLNIWMNKGGARIDGVSWESSGSSAPVVNLGGETCVQSCDQTCAGSCTTKTYGAGQEWPQCGVGANLECCGSAGVDQYCSPVGQSCAVPETVAGQTFSTPAIGRVRLGGSGEKWVAFFASGYNNRPQAPNVGRTLYAVDAYTGAYMMSWSFGDIAPSANNPSTILNTVPGGVALVDVDNDHFVDRVYVGDLEGRLWKVDTFQGANVDGTGKMSNPSAYPACVLFDAGDPNGTGSRTWAPIITRPAVAILQASTSNVYFGTGGDDSAPDTLLYKFFSVFDNDPMGSCRSTPQRQSNLSITNNEWVVGDGRLNTTGGPLANPNDEGTVGDRYWADPVISNGQAIYFASLPGKIESVDPCIDAQGVSKVYGYAVRTFTDASGRSHQAGTPLLTNGLNTFLTASSKVRRAALVRGQTDSVVHGLSTPQPRGKSDVFLQNYAGGSASDRPAVQRLTEGGNFVKSPLRVLRWREVPL